MRRHRKGGARFRQDTPPVKRARVNGEIKAQTVLVIDATGEQLGERSLPDALRLAAEAELDLVEVAAAAQPPVCRIVDYGKFRYDAERKEKLARRNQVRIAVKEVRLRPKIGEHDFAWKLDQVRGFLEQNAKVKIAVIFRGRERERPDRGRQLLDRIATEVAADGAVEQAATFEGRSMFMVVAPTRAGSRGEQRVTGKQHAHAIARLRGLDARPHRRAVGAGGSASSPASRRCSRTACATRRRWPRAGRHARADRRGAQRAPRPPRRRRRAAGALRRLGGGCSARRQMSLARRNAAPQAVGTLERPCPRDSPWDTAVSPQCACQ